MDLDKARAADAPLVFPGAADQGGTAGGGGGPHGVPQTGNVHGPSVRKVADIEQGLRDADVVVEGRYVTQVQTHSALETHGVVADWKPEMLTVWASTQGVSSVREELAGFFKIPVTQIRVSPSLWAEDSARSLEPAITAWSPRHFRKKPGRRSA